LAYSAHTVGRDMQIKKQAEFPLRERYSEVFKITDGTIFAYDNCIYTNKDLPNDLLIHEMTHLEQQKRDGLEHWVENYLKDPEYRFLQEKDAYLKQLASIKDRNWRTKIRIESAKNLSSSLYGNMCTYEEAYQTLK